MHGTPPLPVGAFRLLFAFFQKTKNKVEKEDKVAEMKGKVAEEIGKVASNGIVNKIVKSKENKKSRKSSISPSICCAHSEICPHSSVFSLPLTVQAMVL